MLAGYNRRLRKKEMKDREREEQRDGVRQNERDGEIRLVVTITNKYKYFNNDKNSKIGSPDYSSCNNRYFY